MSGYRPQSQEGGHPLEPLIIDRNPFIVDRTPEGPQARRSSFSGATKPRTPTFLKVYSPFTRQKDNNFVVTQRTVFRKHRDGREESSSSRDSSERGRAPAPPIVIQRTRSRSAPSARRNTKMSPTRGEAAYVPMPPKLPEGEEGVRSRERGSGRDSRQTRGSPYADDAVKIIEESGTGRRSPRPYHSRPQRSDPHETQEKVLEPQSPTSRQSPKYEVIQPNESVRSRQRDGDVYHSKEYIKMKAIAEYNFKAYEEAAERYSSAENRLQGLHQQLANTEKQLIDMKLQQSRASDREEALRRQLEETRRELSDCRRERELSAHQAKVAEDQLERERRRERGQDRSRDRSIERDTDSGGNGQRRRRRLVRLHHEGDEPRTTDGRDPREPRSSAVLTSADDPSMDAITRARADAAKQEKLPFRTR